MPKILRHVLVYSKGGLVPSDRLYRDGALSPVDGISPSFPSMDASSLVLLPGFVDVHVHLREPGFSYKETVRTGTLAAARGGYTTVCPMPNLNPVPDSMEHLEVQRQIIAGDAVIRVVPYGSISRDEAGAELSDMEAMASFVAGFSDDGKGVQSEAVMRKAMLRARTLGKIIAAHCEDNTLLRGGYIHDGEYARAHGHRGICSESEWGQIRRDLELVRETGCAYHVCHVSTKESVALLRQAKAEGLDVTCETAPHYLLLDETFLQEDGRFKMNPPLRSPEDREALLEGLLDGTIDMVATDHAPHGPEEKSRGLEKSAMGVVGLETAFPLLYTYLVKPGILSLERLMELLVYAPCRRFGLQSGEERGDYTLFDLSQSYTIDPAEFQSLGRATPFAGWRAEGRCLLTVCRGQTAWIDGTFAEKE